ncbi:MAG: hypothetical protein V1934_06750 [Methanobacteriota archaeon]
MVTLRGIVDSILSKYGYEPLVRDGIMEAELNGKRINVAFLESNSSYDEIINKLSTREGALILASLVDMDEKQRAEAEGRGIAVWDRRSIEDEIGAAVVTHLEAEKGGLFEMLAVRDGKVVHGGGSLPLMVEDDDATEKILKPSITIEHVKEISEKTTGGYKFELELVPYYFYEYFCIMKISGIESPDKRTGNIGVNALTGLAQPWEPLPEVVSDIDEPHVRLEPKVPQADADGSAMKKVVEMHTEEVERVVEKGHARIYDKIVVKPESGDVTLTPKGLLYVPMWCVEGLHGVMVLNAVTAKVVSEEYYSKQDEPPRSP